MLILIKDKGRGGGVENRYEEETCFDFLGLFGLFSVAVGYY